MGELTTPQIRSHDALILVDVQNDFLPGGALAVPDGNAVIPVLNRFIEAFEAAGQPVYATRDWHPSSHCSFEDQGGTWPPHCIAGTPGASISDRLELPAGAILVDKATTPGRDAYSGFEGTDLGDRLSKRGITRVFVGGLATDYCVLQTVLDALAAGFETVLLTDAIRAVNVTPGDGDRAVKDMTARGAVPLPAAEVSA